MFRHKVAYFVWAVPFVILAYKFLTCPASTSVLQGGGGHFAAAFHQYFAGDFTIGEFGSVEEMFQMVVSNADMPRGMAQYQFTAPFYAGIGYAFGALLGINVSTPKLHNALQSIKSTMS